MQLSKVHGAIWKGAQIWIWDAFVTGARCTPEDDRWGQGTHMSDLKKKKKGGWLKSPDLGNDPWIDQACKGQGPVGLCCGCCPRGEMVAYEADRQVLTAFN